MTKALIKKQLLEMISFLFRGKKGGKPRSKLSMLLYALLFLYAFGAMFFVFYMMMSSICEPLLSAGMGWLYYALGGLMATAFGVIGSVFATQSQLYDAKDNELLLSMPIPSRTILLARMLGLYIQTLLFESFILLPTAAAHWKLFTPSVSQAVLFLLTLLILPLLSLALTCVLGWLIALISSKMRNKSLISIILSLGFLGGYFYLYSNLNTWMQLLIANSEAVGKNIKNVLYPLFQMGRGALGNGLSFLIFTGITAVLFGAVYLILSLSFHKIASAKKGAAKIRYKERVLKTSSPDSALLRREFIRFGKSPVYMLNCGLGTIIMIIGAVFAAIKKSSLDAIAAEIPGAAEILPLIACALLGFLISTNTITAPSVSLEGKNLWILQSLPVGGRQILKAKLKLHMILTAIPAVVCSAILSVVISSDPISAILSAVLACGLSLLFGVLGLTLNLKFPNLDWTNETVAVKQSMSVMLSIFLNWGIIIAAGVLWFAVDEILNTALFLLLCDALVFAVSFIFIKYLMKNGAAKIETL